MTPKRDSLITLLFAGLLLVDLKDDRLWFVDYFNYIYIVFFVIRIIVFCVRSKNSEKNAEECGVKAQWGNSLRLGAQIICFVVAVWDIAG